jgi:hypothetical protein
MAENDLQDRSLQDAEPEISTVLQDALSSAGGVAKIGAGLARRAASAYQRGDDAEAHELLSRLCSYFEDLASFVQALVRTEAARRGGERFLSAWTGVYREALVGLLAARERGDYTLLADCLAADVASSLEALAVAAAEDGHRV